MKTLFSLLAIIGLAINANAQLVSGPIRGSVITISTNFYLPGSTTTNIPTTLANIVPVGKLGTGFFIRIGATNAASTTNATLTLEGSVDESNWFDNQTYTLSVPQNGTTGYDWYTNIQSTTANFGNVRSVRIKSIQNTNLASLWISNFYWTVKE